MLKQKQIKILVVLLSAGFLLLLYGYRLSSPSEQYYDEVYHAKRATQFALTGEFNQKVSTHPPLWHALSAFCISLFGPSSWAWRLPSVLCGVAVVFLLFILAKEIFKDNRIAWFTVFLFVLDGESITQARIGMLNSMMQMFMLLSLFCFLSFVGQREGDRKRAFLGAGLYLGLGLATKMVAAYMIIFYVFFLTVYLFRTKEKITSTLMDAFVYLIILPVGIYLGVYLFISLLYHNSLPDFFQHQHYGYESLVLKKGHRYGSTWWSWPLMIRPIWYFFEQYKMTDIVEGILCIGNPAVFWILPLSMGYVLCEFIRKKSFGCGIILLGFFSQWLPWIFVERVKFFHFFYTAMPFACMSIAVLLTRLWTMDRLGKVLVCLYLFFVVALFLYWYPLLTGYPVSYSFYKKHMWFRSWI